MLTEVVNDDFLCSKKIAAIKINSGILEEFIRESTTKKNRENKNINDAINNTQADKINIHIKDPKNLERILKSRIKESNTKENIKGKMQIKKNDDLKKNDTKNIKTLSYNMDNEKIAFGISDINYQLCLMQQSPYSGTLKFSDLFSYFGAKPISDIYKGLYCIEERKIEVDFGKENLDYRKLANIQRITKLKRYEGYASSSDFVGNESIDIPTKEKWDLVKNTSYCLVLSFLLYELSLN
ncbi:MAG: hypothetical protein N3D84_00600 [Candidatus Woesearchaeota archaeon]|nr:hypothetical protein [Candidatus Woesearchaeota archaeon]